MVKPTILILLFSLPLIVKGCSSHWVGDGYCDSTCNNRENRFDDGDCCEYSCHARVRTYPCGSNGYNCRIPPTPAPTWFTRNTQLCYKWRPDGNGGQCGAGEPRELCAHVGSRTQYYRDDTDNRGGGCRMQWGIRYADVLSQLLCKRIRVYVAIMMDSPFKINRSKGSTL